MALRTNPAIKIAISERKAARADYNAARAGRGISITASHETGRGGYAHNEVLNTAQAEIGLPALYGKDIKNTHTNKLTASIPIYTGGELSGNIAKARANYKSNVVGESKAYIDMKQTATDGYFNMLQAGNKIGRAHV